MHQEGPRKGNEYSIASRNEPVFESEKLFPLALEQKALVGISEIVAAAACSRSTRAHAQHKMPKQTKLVHH